MNRCLKLHNGEFAGVFGAVILYPENWPKIEKWVMPMCW